MINERSETGGNVTTWNPQKRQESTLPTEHKSDRQPLPPLLKALKYNHWKVFPRKPLRI